jgi:hypothetical protein
MNPKPFLQEANLLGYPDCNSEVETTPGASKSHCAPLPEHYRSRLAPDTDAAGYAAWVSLFHQHRRGLAIHAENDGLLDCHLTSILLPLEHVHTKKRLKVIGKHFSTSQLSGKHERRFFIEQELEQMGYLLDSGDPKM